MGDEEIEAMCWLCGRAIESSRFVESPERETPDPAGPSGIPVHRECLEDGRKCYDAGTALADPDDVIYFSPMLFRT